MTTAEMEVEPVVDDLDYLDGVDGNDPDSEYEYPPELLKHWVKLGRDLDLKIASGESKPITVEELAAELGITLD